MTRTSAAARLCLAVLLLLALAAGAAGPADAGKKPPKPHFWLTVLHNNDGESSLLEIVVNNAQTGNQPQTHAGVARFKTLVDRLKFQATEGAEAEGRPGKDGVIMLSSGDNFLAGPQLDASFKKGVPYYDSIAADLIGYDAMAIGNHEFDFGPDVLAEFISGIDGVPFLSANLGFAGEPALQALLETGRIAKSTVVRERGERIGVIGATTPQLPFISSPRNVTVDPNVTAAVQTEIDALERRGIDKIILISHLQDINQDLALAPTLSGIDVMIAGGGDELLANPGTPLIPGETAVGPYPTLATNADGATVPVITTAGNYKYVGKLVVGFDKDGNVIQTDSAHSGPVRVSGFGADAIAPDPAVQTQVVDPVAEHVAALAANVIGTTQVTLNGTRPDIRLKETNMGNLVADSLLWQATELAPSFGVDTPQIALENAGGIRNLTTIPPGPFTELNTFETLSFANFIAVVPDIPATQVKELLENAVKSVPVQNGAFAQIAGFKFTYDTTGTAQEVDAAGNVTVPGTKVKHVELTDGTVLVMNGIVQPGAPAVGIATTDFSARGGDQYPFRGAAFTTLGATYQQALSNYIQAPAGDGGLGGVITAAKYPEAGSGRITRLN